MAAVFPHEHALTGGGIPRYAGIVGTLPALLAEKQQKIEVIRDKSCAKMAQLCALTMAAAVKGQDSGLRNVETKAVTQVGYLHRQIGLIYALPAIFFPI